MKKKIMAIAASVVSCAMLASGLSACGSSSSSDDGNTVELMGAPGEGSVQRKALEQIVDKFEKANPDIKIKLVVGSSSYESDIKVRLSGNNAPDIFNTHGWSRDRYANFLEPLQDRPWAKNVSPVIDSSIKDSKGNFYTLPMVMAISGIAYNATVLDKAGVNPDDITTWDAFGEACEKVKAIGATCIGASGKEKWTGGTMVDYIAPGMFTDKQLDEMKDGKFNTSAYQKMAEMIAEWSKKGYFNVDYTAATSDDISKQMANDTMAFTFQGIGVSSSIVNYNPDAKLGFIPLPAADGDPYIISGEDYALGVSKTSKHKEAALKFIDFAAQPDNYKIYSTATNNVPAIEGVDVNVGVMTDSYNKWITEKNTKTIPVFDRTYLPNGIWDAMCSTTDGLLTGQMDAKVASEQMNTQFTSLYGKK